jgi:hypothetical protein
VASKRDLLRFLDAHVFQPILKASPEDYPSKDHGTLHDVQDRTRSEQERFRHYGSAKEIVDNYKSDLHSTTAKRVNRELERLKLPTLPSVEKQFLALSEGGGRTRGQTG